MTNQKSRPIAVLISDIHYNINTLELADKSLRMAINRASQLGVELYLCGDTHDTKDLMRGKVVNQMIETFKWAQQTGVRVNVLVGNHDRLHEKSPAHALEFLREYVELQEDPVYYSSEGLGLIPYCATQEEFKTALSSFPKGFTILIHQGVKGGNQGHYIQDHSAVTVEDLQGYRTIGGHYHNHHTIGNHTFVGNSYTLNFGEANDHIKGFCVLYSDGTLEHVPTHLRKHIVVERTFETRLEPIATYKPGDFVWLKITGASLDLDTIQRNELCKNLCIDPSFKLDLIPTDQKIVRMDHKVRQSVSEVFDSMIDSSSESGTQKVALKELYREVLK